MTCLRCYLWPLSYDPVGTLRSRQWPEVRRQHLDWQPLCQVCLTPKKVEVHHIRPVHLYPLMELDPYNLVTLCRPHHFLFGHYGDWQSFNDRVLDDCREWQWRIRVRPRRMAA